MTKFRVSSDAIGKRADVFVASCYPGFSRAALAGLFDKQLVVVETKPIKASYKLKQGDELEIDDELVMLPPEAVELPVIYEDDDLVVLNKPAGMLTHSKGALNLEPTVASFLATKITDKNLAGNRAGIVHRLDRHTSGVIAGAKTEASLKHLQKQFAERKTSKTYIAVVEGWPEPPEAIIDAPLERNPKRPQTFRVGAGGKPAQTHYTTLERLDIDGVKLARLELKPVTGRTHQLRVHLAYIGHPIVGDGVYGHDGAQMLLHAKSLELNLPGSSKRSFVAPLPEHFKGYGKA
jgi:23S rRNA pseudouridine1911/1915/1917 synthase